MWDEEMEGVAERKEKEICECYWDELIAAGAVAERFDNNPTSAFRIVDNLIRMQIAKDAFLIQEALVEQHKRRNGMEAGTALYSICQKLLLEQRRTLEELADEARLQDDPTLARSLDGKRVATMLAKGNVLCAAVSRDGRYIAAGSKSELLLWDVTTYEQVFVGKISKSKTFIWDVDFSPDSSRLVSTNGGDTAAVWNIKASKLQTLLIHRNSFSRVFAAKYSPQGDRIATATWGSVLVWDSDNGCLLVNVKVGLNPLCGPLWFNNRLFFITTNSKIKQIDASTGSTVSKWSVPSTDANDITLLQHGKFIAYSAKNDITFWDTLTHTQFGFVSRSSTRLMALSPFDRLLAVVQERKIITKELSCIKVRPHMNKLFPIYTSYTRNRTFVLKTLCSMRGKTLNSSMRKLY